MNKAAIGAFGGFSAPLPLNTIQNGGFDDDNVTTAIYWNDFAPTDKSPGRYGESFDPNFVGYDYSPFYTSGYGGTRFNIRGMGIGGMFRKVTNDPFHAINRTDQNSYVIMEFQLGISRDDSFHGGKRIAYSGGQIVYYGGGVLGRFVFPGIGVFDYDRDGNMAGSQLAAPTWAGWGMTHNGQFEVVLDEAWPRRGNPVEGSQGGNQARFGQWPTSDTVTHNKGSGWFWYVVFGGGGGHIRAAAGNNTSSVWGMYTGAESRDMHGESGGDFEDWTATERTDALMAMDWFIDTVLGTTNTINQGGDELGNYTPSNTELVDNLIHTPLMYGAPQQWDFTLAHGSNYGVTAPQAGNYPMSHGEAVECWCTFPYTDVRFAPTAWGGNYFGSNGYGNQVHWYWEPHIWGNTHSWGGAHPPGEYYNWHLDYARIPPNPLLDPFL